MSSPSAHGAKSPSASRGKGAVRVSPPGACAKSDRRSRTHSVGASAAPRNQSNDSDSVGDDSSTSAEASEPDSEPEPDSESESESETSRESFGSSPRLAANARERTSSSSTRTSRANRDARLRARRRSRDAKDDVSSGKAHHAICLARSSNVALNRTTPPLVQTRRVSSTCTSSSWSTDRGCSALAPANTNVRAEGRASSRVWMDVARRNDNRRVGRRVFVSSSRRAFVSAFVSRGEGAARRGRNVSSPIASSFSSSSSRCAIASSSSSTGMRSSTGSRSSGTAYRLDASRPSSRLAAGPGPLVFRGVGLGAYGDEPDTVDTLCIVSFAANDDAMFDTSVCPAVFRLSSSSARNSASPAETKVCARRPRDATALVLASEPRANPSPPLCDESSMVKPGSCREERRGRERRGDVVARRRSVERSRGVRGGSSSGHSSREATSGDLGLDGNGTSDARCAFASTTSGDARFVHAPESASPTRLGGDGTGAMPARVASF